MLMLCHARVHPENGIVFTQPSQQILIRFQDRGFLGSTCRNNDKIKYGMFFIENGPAVYRKRTMPIPDPADIGIVHPRSIKHIMRHHHTDNPLLIQAACA